MLNGTYVLQNCTHFNAKRHMFQCKTAHIHMQNDGNAKCRGTYIYCIISVYVLFSIYQLPFTGDV